MTTTAERPKGAELDRLVMWVIGVLDPPIYTSDVQFYVAHKAGRVGVDDKDPEFYRMVGRSLDRLRDAGVIVNDERDNGYRFVPIPK